jgi:hypothetical protein
MLCRSEESVRNKLEAHFESWLEKQDSSFSKLANLLVRNEERIQLREESRKNLGYLPYDELTIFTDFSNDLSDVLSLDLERLDKIKVMIDLVGYHCGNYVLSIGETYHNCSQPKSLKRPYYLVEVVSKATNSIRKASIQSISAQRNKLKRALFTRAADIVELYAHMLESEESEEREKNRKNQLQNAEQYLSKNISNYPNTCFKEIGFLSKKSTRSYRYVLTEDFLHSLVVTILGNNKRLEFNQFVLELKNRFSIYVDLTPDNLDDIIQRDLNKNSKQLASLLYQMGMLRHLSDACSYVINPYREDSI